MTNHNASGFHDLILYLNTYVHGQFIEMEDIVKHTSLTISARDVYLNLIRRAGFIMSVGKNGYRLLKNIPADITTTMLNEIISQKTNREIRKEYEEKKEFTEAEIEAAEREYMTKQAYEPSGKQSEANKISKELKTKQPETTSIKCRKIQIRITAQVKHDARFIDLLKEFSDKDIFLSFEDVKIIMNPEVTNFVITKEEPTA